MTLTQPHILELITCNPRWPNWFPYIKGLDFQETQEKRVKEKAAEKLSYSVEKTMRLCEVEAIKRYGPVNGNEFATDVWRYCAAELQKYNWQNLQGEAKFGPRGGLKVKWNYEPVATWKHRIYRNASLKAEKERGFKPIQNAVEEALDGILRQREIA